MIALDSTSKEPLYLQIYDAIRSDVIKGSLKAGDKLIALRKLASELHVSRNTVENAYAQLVAEGYIESRTGSGYVVCDVDFSPLSAANNAPNRFGSPEGAPHTPAVGHASPALPEGAGTPAPKFDFTYGNRPHGSFPSAVWRKLTSEALLSADSQAYAYGEALGEMELRREIARRIHVTRGVNCKPEQVVIQPGTQAALGNLLDLFDAKRDGVALENPGYDGAAAVFRNRGFRISPLPLSVEANEANQKAYIDALHASKAKLLFCTPSNQFPIGLTMPLSMRVRLIEWAAAHDGYIFEDDYCREFRYGQRPIPSLQSLDTRNRVIYMGTFSKVLSPALRMSYAILPPQLLDRWREKFARHYCPVPWLSQKVLYLFMKEGHWDRYTRATMTAYHKRHDLLVECLRREMGDDIDIFGGGAGLHLLVATRDGRSEAELLAAAEEHGVRVYPTTGYWLPRHETDPCGRCVLVGFSSIEPELIPEGIRRLAQAWFPEK